MLATEYAQHYNIEAQREDESNLEFRSRVAGILRGMGKIIEAHEAYQDERYEDSESVMTGITGAIAQAMQDQHYSGDPISNDLAVGTVVQSPEDDFSPEMALLAVLMGS